MLQGLLSTAHGTRHGFFCWYYSVFFSMLIQQTLKLAVRIKKPCAHIDNRCLAGNTSRNARLLLASLFVLALAGCTNSVDDSDDAFVSTNSINETGLQTDSNSVAVDTSIEPELVLNDPATIDLVQTVGEPENLTVNSSTQSDAQLDQAGIADSRDDLAQLLLTDFVLENGQLIPTTGWICSDAVGENRIYYFYQQGVLDANRSVAIERTLNVNDTLTDITFFWSVLSSDALLLTTVNRDASGTLLSSGLQYDVSSLRFAEVDSRQTFVADSVLRGRLVCGNFNLR